MDFLSHVLTQDTPQQSTGVEQHFAWEYLAEGVLSFTPTQSYDKSVVISAGVHGNETAPIELLSQICLDLFAGKLIPKVRLLLILANPLAIRSGQRYIENDMNRMFCGAYQPYMNTVEAQRAAVLEQIVTAFFNTDPAQVRHYHYDLHTAMRQSLLPIFALFPYQTHEYDVEMLDSLKAAELDAVVYHNAVGRTFTHFSSSTFQAASATLELGHAKPFGQNDLSAFSDIDQVLRAVICQQTFAGRQKPAIQSFQVVDSIIKTEDDFQLNLDDAAPNFSVFDAGAVIALQQGKPYVIAPEQIWILFPNTQVKKGLRAGLMLNRMN